MSNNLSNNQNLLTNNNINNTINNNQYNNSNNTKNIQNEHSMQKPFHSSNVVNLYKMDNETIIKEAYNLTKDQIGCRFLQKKIEEDTEFGISFIYPIVIGHLDEIIIDKFGNYLIQKFFEYLPQKELYLFMNEIKDNFLKIGLNQYGTRVIQRIMDFIKSSGGADYVKNYNFFVILIIPNIIQFSNDLNGCHIIQKILLAENFDNNFCYNYYRENIVKIANDKNGCCFLQKCINKLNEAQLDNILESIFIKIKEIVIDQYGNYVIQYVLKIIKEQNITKYNLKEIFKFIIEDLVTYSNQKFCSNVIEKLFGVDELKIALLAKLEQPEIMKALLVAHFGNYVVQKALNYSNTDEQNKLLKIIATMVGDLKKLEFGFKLYNKLVSKYPTLLTIIYNTSKTNEQNLDDNENNEDINNEENDDNEHDNSNSNENINHFSRSNNDIKNNNIMENKDINNDNIDN